MRLFTAIDLSAEVKENLALLAGRLRPTARVKWIPLDNFHITTKFIGEWPEGRLGELGAALRQIPPESPISIDVGGLGWFPNAHSPRVLWAGVNGGDALARLASNTDERLSALGIAAEARAFSPHLSLARIKEPAALDGLRETVAALASENLGSFFADRFFLYLSDRGPAGSVYTKMEEFLLSRP
jgi:2'-5' RNA ligase